MTTDVPPLRGIFSFMNEQWAALGWAKESDDGGYIWCSEREAGFVIGRNMNASSGMANIIAPINQVGRASRTREWQYDVPDYIRASEYTRANENVDRRIRILSGKLECNCPGHLAGLRRGEVG